MIKQFEIGKTYKSRIIVDSNSFVECTIVRRTEKSVWCEVNGKLTQFRLAVVNRNEEWTESFKPWGNYSMCPTIRANQQ